MCSCVGTTEDSSEASRRMMSKLFGDEKTRGVEMERKMVASWLRREGMADVADKVERGEHTKVAP